MEAQPTMDRGLVISYLTLRKIVGILGVSLPVVLAIGAAAIFHEGIQYSISDYYYTGMGNVFVGMLWAIGIFLLSYKGYERKDDVAGDVACVCAIGVSLFPTSRPDAPLSIIGAAHLIFAAALFLTLAYFSLFLFTKTDQAVPTLQKLQRNNVYRVCGIAILGCLLLIAIAALPALKGPLHPYDPRFWLESIAIVAFGISWLTKGEAILADDSKPLALAARA